MLYRSHRGGLVESMQTIQEIEPTKPALLRVLQETGEPLKFQTSDIRVTYYGYDDRIKWDTYLVSVCHNREWCAVGYTNGPMKE